MAKGKDLVSFPNGFIEFNNYLGMPVAGFKKEINSLLKKLDLKKGRGVMVLGGRIKPLASSRFEREIRKLECSVNYNNSPSTIKGKRKGAGT